MILGIDPSFTGTGISLMDDSGAFIFSEKIVSHEKVYESIISTHKASVVIVNKVKTIIEKYDNLQVIVEYPVFRSISGAYLAVLNGMLFDLLMTNKSVVELYWVPPNACDSFTKNSKHSKTYLVNYCKDKGWIDKRVSHDICTAMIFCKLLVAIKNNTYKNTWFKER